MDAPLDAASEMPPSGTRPWLLPLALFAIALVVIGARARQHLDFNHDGTIFKASLDVMAGKIPCRDTFFSYGPLTVWLQASALKLFGPTLLTLRLLTAFFDAIALALLAMLTARLVPRGLAFLFGLLWLGLAPCWVEIYIPWSSVYAMTTQLGCLLVLLNLAALEKDRTHAAWLRAALAGVLAFATFGLRHPVGAFLAAAVVAWLATAPWILGWSWRRTGQNLGAFLLGLAAPLSPPRGGVD